MNALSGWLFVLVSLLLVALFLAVGLGPSSFAPLKAWSLLLNAPTDILDAQLIVVRDLRLPRALLAILIGGALGAAGSVTQGLFRNALAEPSVLGVNMGAALFAVAGFVFGLEHWGLWMTPLLAGAGAAMTLVVLFALAGGTQSIVALLLSGIAISSLCGAVITLMLALEVERWELGLKVMSWLMGSFEGRSWAHLSWGALPLLGGTLMAFFLHRELDLLLLGSDTAASLGVSLKRMRLSAMVCIALLVGGATAVAGVIGFIGLVVPHIARLLVGPAHRRLIPIATLCGALVLLLVDTASRSVTSIALPPGVITSLMGAPFFLWLLHRHERGKIG